MFNKKSLIALSLLISGCGIDVTGEVEFIDAKVKQVNHQFYIGLFAGSQLLFCLPLNPWETYPKDWTIVEDAGDLRETEYTPQEVTACGS